MKNNQHPQDVQIAETKQSINAKITEQVNSLNLSEETKKTLAELSVNIIQQTLTDIKNEKLNIKGNSIFDILKVFKHAVKLASQYENDLLKKLNTEQQKALTDGTNNNAETGTIQPTEKNT